MIDRGVFGQAWKRLEDRWGKQAQGMARDYLAFLSPLMDSDEFVAAATAVWATREFFPRPADFLIVQRDGAYRDAVSVSMEAKEARRMGVSATNWPDRYRALSKFARFAIEAVGGVHIIALDPAKVRRDWFLAYEEAVCTVAMAQAALPAERQTAALPGVA